MIIICRKIYRNDPKTTVTDLNLPKNVSVLKLKISFLLI